MAGVGDRRKGGGYSASGCAGEDSKHDRII